MFNLSKGGVAHPCAFACLAQPSPIRSCARWNAPYNPRTLLDLCIFTWRGRIRLVIVEEQSTNALAGSRGSVDWEP